MSKTVDILNLQPYYKYMKSEYGRPSGPIAATAQRGYDMTPWPTETLGNKLGLTETCCWEQPIAVAATAKTVSMTIFIPQDHIEKVYSYDDVLTYCNNLAQVGLMVRVACPSKDHIPEPTKPEEPAPHNVSCPWCGPSTTARASRECRYYAENRESRKRNWKTLQEAYKNRPAVYAFTLIRKDNGPNAMRMAIHAIRFFAEPVHCRIPALFNKYMAEDGGGQPHNKWLAACLSLRFHYTHSFGSSAYLWAPMTKAAWDEIVLGKRASASGPISHKLWCLPKFTKVSQFDAYLKQKYFNTVHIDYKGLDLEVMNITGKSTYKEVCVIWKKLVDAYGIIIPNVNGDRDKIIKKPKAASVAEVLGAGAVAV